MNHGTHIEVFKDIDRAVISITALLLLYYIADCCISLVWLWALSISLYIFSKNIDNKDRRNMIHVLAHISSVLLFYLVNTN